MGSSQLDIRLPIGLMFCILGALIGVYGAFTNNDPMYAEHSLGINVNLCWGSAQLLFGLVMLGLAWAGRKKA